MTIEEIASLMEESVTGNFLTVFFSTTIVKKEFAILT